MFGFAGLSLPGRQAGAEAKRESNLAKADEMDTTLNSIPSAARDGIEPARHSHFIDF